MVMERSVFLASDRNDIPFRTDATRTSWNDMVEFCIVLGQEHPCDAPVRLSI